MSDQTPTDKNTSEDALDEPAAERKTLGKIADLLQLDVTSEADGRVLEVLEALVENGRRDEVAELADHLHGFEGEKGHVEFELWAVETILQLMKDRNKAADKRFSSLGTKALIRHMLDPKKRVGKLSAAPAVVLLMFLRISDVRYAALDVKRVLRLLTDAVESVSQHDNVGRGTITHVQILAELMAEVGAHDVQNIKDARRLIRTMQRRPPAKKARPSTLRIKRAWDETIDAL